MTAMERNDTSASVGLSASLVVHALLLLGVIGWYIRDVDQQWYYPPLPVRLAYSGLGWVDGKQPADTPDRVLPAPPPEPVKPAEPPKLELPKPKPLPKPKSEEDPRFARFGDRDGKGEAINSGEGDLPLRAREGPQEQAWLSRDPAGPGKLPPEPSFSTLIPGDNGSGPKGGAGKPSELRLPPRPAADPQQPAFGVKVPPPTPQLMPRRPMPSPAEEVVAAPASPLPPLPPAPPPAPPPSKPAGPRAAEPLIALGKEPPAPRLVVLTTQPAEEGPKRVEIVSTMPASPDSLAKTPLPNAAPTTAPSLASATQPARQYAQKPIESPRYDLTGQSTSTERAREETAPPATRPVLAQQPTTRPTLAMAVPAAPQPSMQPAMPAASGASPGGNGGRPGPRVAPADPAPLADSESDAFAKVASVDFTGGKVSARLGRQVRPIKPRLTLKGELDLSSMMDRSVTLKISINEAGKVTNVQTVRSSGSNEVDHPTVLAVYQWWIEPKKDRSGAPVNDVIVLKMSWH